MRFWSIPGALVVGYREAIGLLIGGGMALLFGLIFATTGTGALMQEYQFLTNSTTGIAEVIDKRISSLSAGYCPAAPAKRFMREVFRSTQASGKTCARDK